MKSSCTVFLVGLVVASCLSAANSEGAVKKLKKENLAKAREFIMAKARPLEQALYRLRFEDGSAADVRTALRQFQNPNGGFGKALEPDLRAPESSVLATMRALQALAAVNTPREDPMVTRAMAYLTSTFDDTKGVWRIIPSTAGAYPHAPWWNQEQLDQVFGGFLIFPRAELLGFLFAFDSPSFPLDKRTTLLRSLLDLLEKATDPQSAGAVESCVRLYETGHLPAEYKDRLYQKLAPLVPRAIEQNPQKWSQYCLKPTWLVRTPESPFLPLVADSVELNLDYEIENQSTDGSWAPNWSWYGAYPETWPVAETEWRGVLTVQTLETLQAFGRIEQ